MSPLPVVYKLLTAQDQGASTAAVQMLTFLCQMGSQRQRQEQLALAKFGNGVILDIVVQRIKKLCSQTKPSTAKAAELTSLLHLLSSATSGDAGNIPNNTCAHDAIHCMHTAFRLSHIVAKT